MSERATELLASELEQLRRVEESSSDPRITAVLVAASDGRVTEILNNRIAAGFLYRGALVSVEEEGVGVLFSFARRVGQFGLIPPSLRVMVDVQARQVARLEDNYLGGTTEVREPGALQPEIDISPWLQSGPEGAVMRTDGGTPDGNTSGAIWC